MCKFIRLNQNGQVQSIEGSDSKQSVKTIIIKNSPNPIWDKTIKINIDTYKTRYNDFKCSIISRYKNRFLPICYFHLNWIGCIENPGKWYINQYFDL